MRPLVLVALFAASLSPLAATEQIAAQEPAHMGAQADNKIDNKTGAPITVQQLEQKLDNPPPLPPAFKDGGEPALLLQDANTAQMLDELRLSERLTPATLEHILSAHKFGPQAQRALNVLSYRSALLDPPAAELPDRPAPDAQQQQQILDAARIYVAQVLKHLPNFFATRTTYQFYGVPPELNETGLPVQVGLLPKGHSSREITYRGGVEILDPMKSARTASTLPEPGLESWGEFGVEAAVILMDSGSTGYIAFHHWEQTPAGVAAVFRYAVPEQGSHYEVSYSCLVSQAFRVQPAYQGSIAIDPTSGAVLRLTLEAAAKPGDPISHVASVIEYDHVDIGGRDYVCPVRSLAFSVEDTDICHRDAYNRRLVQPMTLNRSTFTDYHRLGSTSRMITDVPPEPVKPNDMKQSQPRQEHP